MEEEFYCVLKLVTGEEIFSLIFIDENDGDPIISLQNPVVMKMIHSQYGCVVKIKPWMELPEDDFYFIKSDKVVTMTEIRDKKLINGYEKFVNEKYNPEEELEGKVKISDKMGYISSVEEARKKLESIYKDL
jgi:Sm_like domain